MKILVFLSFLIFSVFTFTRKEFGDLSPNGQIGTHNTNQWDRGTFGSWIRDHDLTFRQLAENSISDNQFVRNTKDAIVHPQRSITAQELHELRIQRVVEAQTAAGWECGVFRSWLNSDNVTTEDVTFCLSSIGCYDDRVSISEYYDLALLPGGGCGNALGRRLVRLDGKPIVGSIEQSSENPDIYTGYHIVTGYYGPDFSTQDGFFAITRGHLVSTRAEFLPGTGILKKWVSDIFGNELVKVSLQFGAITAPSDLCSLMNDTQLLYTFRFGYYPANVSGFELLSPQGFQDCVDYWTNIQNEGDDKCGTPLATHSLTCAQLHMLTFLGNNAGKVHAEHWAKADLHTKCIDYCLPVLDTCNENASQIPASEINFENAAIDYFCQCPEGTVGNGVDSCEPVTCRFDWDCRSLVGSHCNFSQSMCEEDDGDCDPSIGICMTNPSFSWNTTSGEAFCPDDSQIYYNFTNGYFECIPDFKCWNKWQCNIQHFSTVSCEYPGNLASPLGVCECNYGFEGGYVLPCTCPKGKVQKRVSLGEKVCIDKDQCTKDRHCGRHQTCIKENPEDLVGQCTNSTK